jgi:serine/threonine protein kinase
MKMQGGRYAVETKPTHSGVFGKIFFGMDTVLERDVAIKEVDDLAAGKREARALAAVAGHEAILSVYDFFEDHEHGFIVTERIYGKPLGDDEWGRRRRGVFAVETTMSTLRGLRHMHRPGSCTPTSSRRTF